MTAAVGILAALNPIEHILDVPWRIGGRDIPWLSSQIGVMLLAGLILLASMPLLARRRLRRKAPGDLGPVEIVVAFVRTHIARLAMGDAGDKAVPFLATLFCFLLLCNLLGLVPLSAISEAMGLSAWGGVDAAGRPMNVTPVGGTPASGVWVCAAFAAMTFMLVLFSGYVVRLRTLWKGPAGEHAGDSVGAGANVWLAAAQRLERRTWPLPIACIAAVWSWLNGFVPPMPGVVGLVMWPFLLMLELVGYVAKCFALCIRLLANMTAGHILLAVLIAFAQGSRGWLMALVGVPAALGVIAFMVLELLVSVIQAYIFTFLSALFISLAMNPQH